MTKRRGRNVDTSPWDIVNTQISADLSTRWISVEIICGITSVKGLNVGTDIQKDVSGNKVREVVKEALDVFISIQLQQLNLTMKIVWQLKNTSVKAANIPGMTEHACKNITLKT